MGITITNLPAEPQRNYKWLVRLPIIIDPITAGTSFGGYGHFLAREIAIPSVHFTEQPIHVAAGRVNIADFFDIDRLTISFWELENSPIQLIIRRWNNLIMNSDQTYNFPVEYKQKIVCQLLDVSNQNALTTITCYGCFPVGPTVLNFSYVQWDALIISQQFSVDWVEYDGYVPMNLNTNSGGQGVQFPLPISISLPPFSIGNQPILFPTITTLPTTSNP